MQDDFKYLLYPKSIAVFGVSRSVNKPGRVVFDNLIDLGYRGKVYPINPHAEEIRGYKVYDANVKADVAILAVNAEAAVEIAEKYGKNFKFLVILSGGFSEVGRDDLSKRLLNAAKLNGFRIIGPNCLGIINTEINLNATFLPNKILKMPKQGNISLISQSGANIAVAIDFANKKGIGINKVISYGNQLDVKEYELLNYLNKDESTKVIGAYIEGISNGNKFYEVVNNLNKKLVILKAGRSNKAKEAAKSHTASLAGSYEVFKGVSNQLKISLVDDFEELFLTLHLFSNYEPKGDRIFVVTCGGGYGVMTVDMLEKYGLNLANLNKKKLEQFKEKMPSRVVVNNPLDTTGDGNVQMFYDAFEYFKDDYDLGIAILLPQLPSIGEDYSILKRIEKPLVLIIPGREVKCSLPNTSSIETAVKSIKSFLGVTDA